MAEIDVNTWVLLGIFAVNLIWTAFWGLIPPVASILFALYMQKRGFDMYVARAEKKGQQLERKLKKGLLKLVTEEIWKKENMKPLRGAIVKSIRGWYANVIKSEQNAMAEIINEGGIESLSPVEQLKYQANLKFMEKTGISATDLIDIFKDPGKGSGPQQQVNNDDW